MQVFLHPEEAVKAPRTLLGDQAFSVWHRASPTAFTRVRFLPFAVLIIVPAGRS
jgi:hypothetical protein